MTEKKDFSNCKVQEIYGANYSGYTNHVREGSRAIIIKDGNILLSHEVNIEQWMIPGGGIEAGETPEICCVREMAEETGLIVETGQCFLILNEYYEDWKFVSYYFTANDVGITERKPTKREMQVGATPEWISFDKAMDIFSHHEDYADTDEERRGIYQREYIALQEFVKKYSSRKTTRRDE